MAARKIETTIALDGEQAFKSALSSATREMRVMESEMKALSAAYDANGNSAQFFAAKQSNLRNQIAQQREIIQSLERAVEDAGKAYGANSAQVDAYAIRLNNARARLSRLEQQLSETDSEMEELGRDAQRAGRQLEDGIGEGAEEAQSKLESLVSAMKEDIGSIQASTAITAVKTVWDMATGAYSSIAGFVEGTAEYRKQLSFLKQNAELNGFDFDKIEKQLIEVTGLTGDSSAAIEGLSNLLAAGVDERQLEEAIDSLAGAVISFPDTLKFESLADGLQETLATGTATGAFGELLERLGVDLEEFNGALAASDSAAGDLDIALSYLAAHGMTDVYNQWKETNGAMSEAAQTQAALEIELAEFAGTLEKYITTPVKQVAVDAMSYINDLVALAEEKGLQMAGKKVADDLTAPVISEMEEQDRPQAEIDAAKKLLAGEAGNAETEILLKQRYDEVKLWFKEKLKGFLKNRQDEELDEKIQSGWEAGNAADLERGIELRTSILAGRYYKTGREAVIKGQNGEEIMPIGVREDLQQTIEGLIKDYKQSLPDMQSAGAEMGDAMSEGMQQSTQDMSSLFPKQVVVETENAIPAMGIAGEEAGKKYGEGFANAYKGFAESEFAQIPNPMDNLAPGQAIVDTLGVAEEWKTMLDSVTDAAGSASSAMTEEGAAMGANFAEGISSSMGEVSSAAEQLTAAAEEGASSASGAGAFSAGSSIGAQLAAGLLSQVSYVASAAARLGSAASSGLGGGGVRTYGTSGGTSGVINTVLNIDGRSFASATSSYMSAALAVRV